MWSLYFLFNKILNVVDEEKSEENIDHSGECNPVETSSFHGSSQDEIFLYSRCIPVPHINQLHSWDCGLACVLMVLNTIGIDGCSIQNLADLCSTTSIWTVDLAYLLQKFSVSFSYYTVTVGANPNYSAETFYQEQLPTDLLRVDMLFQKALDQGINIQFRSIDEREISQLILSGKYIAIALVDQYKLSKSWLEDVIPLGLNFSNSGYAGHYVVICGYDGAADEFEIRDPATSRKHERISSKSLEEARKCFGTDEDLLLISLEKREGQERSFTQFSQPTNGSL